MRAWLKGGLIGAIIGFFVSLIVFYISILSGIGLSWWAQLLSPFCPQGQFFGCVIPYGPIIFIVLGFVVGLIIGIVKSRK